jgi:hypothetical protein
MPNDVRERIKRIDICVKQGFNEKTRSYEMSLSDDTITAILAVVGEEIERTKKKHNSTCTGCAICNYNQSLTDLRARLEKTDERKI